MRLWGGRNDIVTLCFCINFNESELEMTDKTGGPAFPTQHNANDPRSDGFYSEEGMTLRDYFAAKAMQAAATNPTGADGFTFEQRAKWAYKQADAMIEARLA